MKHKLHAIFLRVKSSYATHKKRWIAGIAVFLVLAISGGAFAYSKMGDKGISRTSPDVNIEPIEEKPKTAASPLTGVQVSPATAKRPVTAIVIENSPDARPQSSLSEAGLVFESIAEGGITRFLAMYQEARPKVIGPVRSLRPYFIDWVQAFDASIAHVGGSAQALDEAKKLGLKDMDEFFNASSFYRTTDRFAPHNLYTNFDLLDDLNKRLGYTESKFDAWPRKEDSPLKKPTAKKISVDISSFTFSSSYVYNSAKNNYQRSTADVPDKDREPNKQLAPKVVIVMEAEYRVDPDGRYQYDLIGSGKVSVFQDGGRTVGTWKKPARDKQFSFVDDQGNVIKLNAGQVWVAVLSPSQEVVYTP